MLPWGGSRPRRWGICRVLRRLRATAGLTQYEAARATCSNMEQGRTVVADAVLQRARDVVADALARRALGFVPVT